MIINPPIHAAYVFDMLAIFGIKMVKTSGELYIQSSKNYSDLKAYLCERLGNEEYSQIVRSDAYAKLYQANIEVFNRIDEIKVRGEQLGDATYIDQKNYDRYLAKKALQEKFFPDSVFNEQKIGYNKL